MTGTLAEVGLALASKSSSKTTTTGSSWTLLIFVGIFVIGYFFFIRPRSQAAKRQRQEGTKFEVGDEILTVGGIVGRVIEDAGEHLTIVTGHKTADGEAIEPPHHRMVIVRQAVARKLSPIVPGLDDEDLEGEDLDDEYEEGGEADDDQEVDGEDGDFDDGEEDDEDHDEAESGADHDQVGGHGDDGAPTGGPKR